MDSSLYIPVARVKYRRTAEKAYNLKYKPKVYKLCLIGFEMGNIESILCSEVDRLKTREEKNRRYAPWILATGIVIGGVTGGLVSHYYSIGPNCIPEIFGTLGGMFVGGSWSSKGIEEMQEQNRYKAESGDKEPLYYSEF